MLPHELACFNQGALPPAICAEIIEAAEKHGRWLRSGQVGYTSDNFVGDSRTSSETWVERYEPLLWVRDQLIAAATRTLDKYLGSGGPQRYFYESRVIRYQMGEYLRAHEDNPRPLSFHENPDHGARAGHYYLGWRKVFTLVFYLNDNYSGGQLKFLQSGQNIAPTTGDLLLFPPSELHESLPVLEGTKYIVTNALFYAD
ncbi:hypothetical protein Misp06_01327 [Microbulbifer sp. NBRC 101763]|uniref:prolyl hydroxylase family protein n=1 Tax=Microbulbifer TaxID=48073 RepID=UPI000368A50E|nr:MULTISPECIES: 2OG-Fe(II) oxygenase [Microbulbifer]WHI51675.1 2OG-Fe(II) oxygenase [Microbulbifer sp. MLAF003]